MNILLILTDDQRADTTQYMANVTSLIARNGTTFTNAYAPTTLCCPSRTSLLSGGLYAYETRVLTNVLPNGGASQFYDADTLPVRLQKEGYKTAIVGKYLNDYERLGNRYIPPGWTHANILSQFSSPKNSYYNFTMVQGSSGPNAPNHAGKRVEVVNGTYITDYLTNDALEFLDRNVNNRFFLYLAYNAPHEPYIPKTQDLALFSKFNYASPATREKDLSDKPTYVHTIHAKTPVFDKTIYRKQLATLQSVDSGVGQIMKKLDDLNMTNNTLVIFASDNGFEWGEHGGLRNKETEYEESLKVPLIIRDPQTAHLGPRTNNEIISYNLDVAKTIFTVAGVDGSYGHGTNLLPLVRDEPHIPKTRAIYQGYGSESANSPMFMAIRDGNYKYIELTTGEKELYDEANDPWELNSLHNNSTYTSLMNRLSAEMDPYRGLTILPTSISNGTAGEPYNYTIMRWGGKAPFSWSMYNYTHLPAGLTLDTTTGNIHGLPRTEGTYNVQIMVQDSSTLPLSGLPQRFIAKFTLHII